MAKRQQAPPSYHLGKFHDEITALASYQHVKSDIERNCFREATIDDNTIKIFSPEIFMVLFHDKLKCINLANDKPAEIKERVVFLKIYIEEFKKGVEDFKENFPVGALLYGDNQKTFVKKIHERFLHTPIEGTMGGWKGYVYSTPFLINEKIIGSRGFYAGIISALYAMIDNHKADFRLFDECTEACAPQTNDVLIPGYDTNLFTCRRGELIFDEFIKLGHTSERAISAMFRTMQSAKYKLIKHRTGKDELNSFLANKNISINTLRGLNTKPSIFDSVFTKLQNDIV